MSKTSHVTKSIWSTAHLSHSKSMCFTSIRNNRATRVVTRMRDRLLKALRNVRAPGRIYAISPGTDGQRMALRSLISHHARFQHTSRRMLDSELSTLDDLTGKVKQRRSGAMQRLPRPEALEPQVILKRLGYVHEFRLNRPKALNALNPSMIQSLRQQIPVRIFEFDGFKD